MKYSDFMVWADDLIQIYLRCGPRPFTHAEISDITHRGTMNRYAERGYFVRVRNSEGSPLKKGVRGRANVWRFHDRIAWKCQSVIAEHERLEADLGWNRDLPDVLWRSPEWRSGGEDLEERS